jgi:heme exporter protein CcmD
MSELFTMDGNGPYVWAAWGITLAVVIINVWSARNRLKRLLGSVAGPEVETEAPRRPKVTQL